MSTEIPLDCNKAESFENLTIKSIGIRIIKNIK
jgi:hypothetical protein